MLTSERSFTPAGVLAASGGVFAWGIGIVIIKTTTSPVLIASFYRHAFALPVLLAIWLFTKDRTFPWRVAGIGGVLFGVHQMAHFGALHYSTAAVVTIFFSLQPILIGAAGRRITGEQASRRFFAWAGVAVSGCAVLVLASADQPGATPFGTLLAVANLILWSSYFLATKRARAQVNTISWLFVMTLVSGCVVGLTALVTSQPFAEADTAEWTRLAFIALIPGTLGHFLVTWAHPRIHAAASSSLSLAVPVIASIGAAIVVDEPFGPWHALGALIAIGGAGMALRNLPPMVSPEAAQRYGEAVT